MEELWVYMEKVELRYWLEHSDEKNMNKLVELKAFVDTYGIKSADLKNKLLFKTFRYSISQHLFQATSESIEAGDIRILLGKRKIVEYRSKCASHYI